VALTRYQQFRQFISDFIDGPNAEAFFQSISDQLQAQDNLSVAVTDQLTISTSSGVYLDQLLAAKGVVRPGDLGMSDFAFSEMGITIVQEKLITDAIMAVLAAFYGDQATRATTISGVAAPYVFKAGDDLQFTLENGVTNILTLVGDEFEDINNAQAEEIASVISRYIASLGSEGYAQVYTDFDTGAEYVQIFGGARGPYSLIQIVGGTIQNELEFPTIRPTMLPSNTTVWQITRNLGDTYRFSWNGGPQPLLSSVLPGDSVMIYGEQFQNAGFYGTFTVTAASPCQPTPAADAGYFEIQVPMFAGPIQLASIPVNGTPPPNNPPTYYSITLTQALYSDLKFFLPYKNTAYSQIRYALAWEPADGVLKIYMPASTQVIERNLIGSAHTHLLYTSQELNGSFGSATDITQQIQVVNPYTIKYPSLGYDVAGTGGTLTVGLNTFTIQDIFREQAFTTVQTTTPHGITGIANSFGQVFSTQIVGVNVGVLLEDDPINTFLGAYMVDPTANYTLTSQYVTLRQSITAGQNVSSLQVTGQLPNTTGQLLFALNQNNQESPVTYLAAQSAAAAMAAEIETISQNGHNVTCTTDGPSGLVVGQQVSITGTLHFNGTWTVVNTPANNIFTFTNPTSQIAFETTGLSTPIVAGTITTLIMDTAYRFQFDHAIGEDVTLISSTQAYTPALDGSDYSFFVTGTANGRVYAQQIVEAIIAAGVNVEIIILYPDDEGWGNAGDSTLAGAMPQSDVVYIYGPDPQ
jgi:hypothetical protein